MERLTAEPTGNRQIDEIIREYEMTDDELKRFLESRPGDEVSMRLIAQRITSGRRDRDIVIRWGT